MKVYKSSQVVGYKYYNGFKVFKKLKAGVKLKLKYEKDNVYDENAVEVYYKKTKLGYLPKHQNYSIAQVLKQGHEIFKAYVQNIDNNNNIYIAISIKKNT